MDQSLELSDLENHYSKNPDSIIFAFLASRNLEHGNAERALSICEQGVKKHPQYPFGHFMLGLCHYHLKDYSKAKTHFEISTGYDDKNPKAWKLLGEINEQLELSLLAEECNLNYYLLDSFNPDALEKYQKEELIDFDAFRTDFSPEEMPPTEVKEDSDVLEESQLGTSFESPQEEDEDLNLSKAAEDDYEEPLEEASRISEGEKVKQVEGQETEDWLKVDEKSEQEPTRSEQDKRADDVRGEEASAADEERDISDEVEEAEPESEQSDDLLDFKSIVKDIISEDRADASQALEEEPERAEDIDSKVESPEQEETKESDKKVARRAILTPTIGEIYIAQGRFDEAIDVFEQLLEKEPHNNRYRKKIEDVKAIIEKQKLRSMGN